MGGQPSDRVSQRCAPADAEQVPCHARRILEMVLLSDNPQQQGGYLPPPQFLLQWKLRLPVVNMKGFAVVFFPNPGDSSQGMEAPKNL